MSEKHATDGVPPGQSMTVYGRPPGTSLIYGLVEWKETLAFIDRQTADDWRRAIEIGSACSTVSDLRTALTDTDFGTAWLPHDLDELDGLELRDDDPIDVWQSNAAQNGDWPPMPDALTLHCLPADLLDQFGDIGTTVFNGDIASISPAHAPDLVDALRNRGISCERDDRLVALLDHM